MPRRQLAATARTSQEKSQRELEDLQLVLRARNGDGAAMNALIRRYTGFVRLKASSYFLAGGDSDDLVQEGLIGLYKAVRERPLSAASPRSASHGRSSRRSRRRPASSTHRSTPTSPSARRRRARRRGSARSATRSPVPESRTRRSASSPRRSSRASCSHSARASRRWRATRFASTSKGPPTR